MSALASHFRQEVKKEKTLPWPLVSFKEHPIRWTRNKVHELLISIPFSHLALLVWVALYYIAFQLVHPIKMYWDTLLSQHIRLLSQHNWNDWRHFFRDGGEAYLVTMTVLFFTANPYKYKLKKIHSVAQVFGRIGTTLIMAIPLFVVFGLLTHWLQHWFHTGMLAPSIGSHPGLAAKLYADGWTTKVVVVAAGLLGRKPMYPVFDFVMDYFAERRVARGKKDHMWHPAPYRAKVREKLSLGQETVQQQLSGRDNFVIHFMRWGTLVIIALAIYGGYILNHYK